MIAEDLIKKIKNGRFTNGLIYLLRKINDNSGFFCFNNQIIYMIKNTNNISYKSLETTSLVLNCNIKIINVEEYPSFESGYYNIIIFKNDINNSEFNTFVKLCEIYSNTFPRIDFDEFFFELSDIFQLPKEENYKNIVGFYGELAFISISYNKYGLCLADKWHVNGSRDRFDFIISKDVNCEVKSSVKDNNTFRIKHSQIFNNQKNFIIVINLEENTNGYSVIDLITQLNKKTEFSSNLNFQLRLAEETQKCNISQLKSHKFRVTELHCFLNDDLDTINNIPSCISDITYDYNFDSDISIDILEFYRRIL